MNKKKVSDTNDRVPLISDEQGSLGDIKINHSVVASIVRLSTLEVEGVHSVGSSLVDGIAEIFSKKESDRGVRVTETDSGNYDIEVRVILNFGVELARVAVCIQQNVREKVSTMTLKDVNRVDVIIDGVRLQTASEKLKEQTWADTTSE
ncbi:MAG: hypothetical protein A2Y14_04580 [Verrucomicrobia bacterium GWF2_51_19]|nr:MAG: hypothetical protein A2Y14_04580 [Verrucomicrobia bacterium GWF2_51_19]HCJ12524.1 Asp23/Gls24 family envelope stress response protein [Opitutae bacterium]